MKTEFSSDIIKGKAGESIFIKKYLDPFKIEYKDVSTWPYFRSIGIDFNTNDFSYDVKNTYRDNERIVIEEDSSIKKKGWIYTSEADIIVFLSEKSNNSIFLNLHLGFKEWYIENKELFDLRFNKTSFSGNNEWQSSYRILDLSKVPQRYFDRITF
jgi:hypothetical protein